MLLIYHIDDSLFTEEGIPEECRLKEYPTCASEVYAGYDFVNDFLSEGVLVAMLRRQILISVPKTEVVEIQDSVDNLVHYIKT